MTRGCRASPGPTRPGLGVAAGVVGLAGTAWTTAHLRSPSVRTWRRSRLPSRGDGPLFTRCGGDGDHVVVLLHGLVASGDIFGAAYDSLTLDATVVVPDLLGFGRSLDEQRGRFGVDDHLDALDGLLTHLGLDARPLVIGAHSMGAAVAVHWARRRGSQVRRLVTWGAPVYGGEPDVMSSIAASSPMTRLFVTDTKWARLACRINCRHRTASGWIAAAVTPTLPVPIAREASLHTWPAYRDAMYEVVMATDWPAIVSDVTAADTEVWLRWGVDDPIGDRRLVARLDGVDVAVVRGADHRLPLTHPDRCRDEVTWRRDVDHLDADHRDPDRP